MATIPEPNLVLSFEDQSTEREILEEILKKESGQNLIGAVAQGPAPTVFGPGGVGKTQTIFCIAHRHDVRERFPGGLFSSDLVQKQARKRLYFKSHIWPQGHGQIQKLKRFDI